MSFEHEIENRKNEYYQALRSCQAQRPKEDVTVWMLFFLTCLSNIQKQLSMKLNKNGLETKLSPKEKLIFTIIQNRPNIQSGEILIDNTNINQYTLNSLRSKISVVKKRRL